MGSRQALCLLVALHGRKDRVGEVERGEKAEGPHHEEEAVGEDHHVGEVDGHRQEPVDVAEGRRKEGDGVHGNVGCDGTAAGKGGPPPPVVLCAELQVGGDDRDLGGDDAREGSGDEDKAKEVVEVSLPHRGHGEVEHDEDVAEDEEAAAEEVDKAVDLLLRDLAGDLVGAGWEGVDGGLGGHKAAEHAERDRDQPPEDQDREVRLERDGARGPGVAQEDVDDGQEQDHDAREEEAGAERHVHPLLVALEQLPCHPDSDVTADGRGEDVDADAGAEEGPAGCGGQEPERRKDSGGKEAEEDVDPGPDLHAELHGRRRQPEDVAHHQLPAVLLTELALGVSEQLLVPGDGSGSTFSNN